MKENDYLLNMLSNPDFTESDFKEVGLTTDNTSIEKNREIYKNLDFVRNNPMLQTDGEFDEVKFNQAYDVALQSYNNFAQGITSEKIAKEHNFYRNDIYASYDDRNNNIEAYIHREANPLRQGKSLIHAGDVTESPYSVREIAQTLKVWDEQTKSWLDAPNESFFNNFLETRVLAQWDEDGEHEDPITGKIVKHKKGEKKINENGTFYYENLNGRDIYGREVLSKFDTLTVDGTFVNKFDFFDSDDKKKSVPGTIVKNAVKVIPAFIPYVSPVYLGLRVGLNTVDLMAKLGKVFTGSDSPTLSALEGFSESLSFSTSDYAKGSSEAEIPAHAWSMENLINMGADTFTQLAELRWLLKFAPALIKGRAGIDNSFGKPAADKIKRDAWKAADPTKSLQSRLSAIQSSAKNTVESRASAVKAIAELGAVSEEVGERAFNKYMKDYQELGKIISQVYMTGVTVGDAYGEAKQEKASDMEASLLTLGYALGEYLILNSDLGKWILPELKANKRRFTNIAKTLADVPKPDGSASPAVKMNWISKIVNFGKKAAEKVYNNASTQVLPSIAAGAIAEGVEEVSEELLYDVSKSLFNVVGYLRNDETKLSAFDDVASRYALSFVGGAIGGGITGVDAGFREAKAIKELKDKDTAFQQLVHIVKEGQANDFLSTVDKMTWNSLDLSAVDSQDTFGETSYLPGTTKENQDKAIKDAMHLQVAIIQKILDANGALIDDESILGILTDAKKDLKYKALQQSTFAASYLQEFNDISAKIVNLTLELNKTVSDEERESATYKQHITDTRAKLVKALAEKDAYVKGQRTGEFIEKALFEMSEDISSMFVDVNKIQWIESREGKKIKDISPERIKTLEKEWNDWSAYNRKDKLELAFRIFKAANLTASDMLKKYSASYFDDVRNKLNAIVDIQNLFGARTESYTALDYDGNYLVEDDALTKVSQEGAGEYFNPSNSVYTAVANVLVNKFQKLDPIRFDTYNKRLNDIFNKESNLDQETDIVELMLDLLQEQDLVDDIVKDLDEIPYLNFATKNQLLKAFELLGKVIEVFAMDMDPIALKNSEKIANIIKNKSYSPALELINSWSLSMNNLDVSVEKLINLLNVQDNTLAPTNTLDEFSILEDNAKRIDNALKNIKLLKATILAARTDGVSSSNRVGYNVTANEVLKQDLAEIDKNNANVLLLDINKVESLLEYYKRLHTVNTGQKLKEHFKVSTNKDIITFNKLKKLVLELDWPPKDWNGVAELKNALSDNFEIIDRLNNDDVDNRRLNLNEIEKVGIKRDMLKLDTAIHNFFAANQDKLSDPTKLATLLSPDLFGFHHLDDGLLTSKTSELSDTLFVWWLATRAAMNPNDFYKTYKDNFISGIAPIPAQELAIMTAVAGVLNGEVFHNFAKAYNESLKKKTEQLDDKYFAEIADKRSYLKEDYMDSDRAILFFRHLLIEGVAGSGKSTAVAKSIVNLLRQSDKGLEILNNVWFVHASKDQAKTMAADLGYGEDYEHVYSREEYLEKISPNVTKLRHFDGDVLALNKEDLIQRPDETLYRYNAEINKGFTKEPPSMIIFDEVTGFSLQDLLLSEDFSEHYGIMNLTFGDFIQDGLVGYTKLDNDGNNLNSEIFRGNFIGSIKLGDSLRTANGVKDYNNKQLQAHIYNLLNGNSTSTLQMKWYTDGTEANDYLDATVILGDKIYADHNKLEHIKADIDVLLNQLPDKEVLKDHEKLGFIYDDKNSPVYQYLDKLNKSGKFKNKILMKEGSSSQGMEADFYVIDLNNLEKDNPIKNRKHFRRVYTGLTRAKKASIAVLRNTPEINSVTKPEESPGEFSLSLTGIDQFSLAVKKTYDEVYTEGNQLTYKRFGELKSHKTVYTINDKEYTQIEKPNGINLEQGDKFSYDKNVFVVKDFIKSSDGKTYVWAKLNDEDYLWETSEFKNNILPKIKYTPDVKENLQQKDIHKDNLDKIDVVNNDETKLNMILHSFATNETGIIEERTSSTNGISKVKYRVSEGFNDTTDKDGKKINGRVDGINGLIKIMGITPDSNGYISGDDFRKLQAVLDKVRAAALYSTSQQEILDILIQNVDLLRNKSISTKLIFKSSLIPGKSVLDEKTWFKGNTAFSKFFKSIEEKVRGLFVNKGEHVLPTLKHISLMITEKSGTSEKAILEIPLLNLTNPLTMINTVGFEEIAKVVEKAESELKAITAKPSSVDILKKTLEKLQSNPVKMSNAFTKLSRLYLDITDGKVLLLDEMLKKHYGLEEGKITLSNIFEGTGPLITSTEKGTGEGRHAKYRDAELEYDGLWMTLTKYKQDSGKAVSDIFVTGAPLGDIKVGHPFVLVSDAVHIFDANNVDEHAMVEQYLKLMNDPSERKLVKLVYVSPPSVSVQDYFKNLNSVYKKDDDVDPTIGSELTSFNLLKMIMQKDLFNNKELMSEIFTKPDTGYSKLKTMVEKLATIQESMSTKDFLELLSGDGKIDGVDLLTFYKDIFGKDSKISNASWKSFLQSQLRWYVLSNYNGGRIDFSFDSDINDPSKVLVKRMEAILEMLKAENMDGIFYSPELSRDTVDRSIGNFKRVSNNNGMYKGKSYTINGKIDSQAFKANVLPIIDMILNANRSDVLKNDTTTYIHDNYGIFDVRKNNEARLRRETINKFMSNVATNNESLSGKIKNKIDSILKVKPNATDNEIISELSKEYLIRKDETTGKNVIFELEKGIKLTSDPEIININGKDRKISNVQYNENTNKWELILEPEVNPESEKSLNLEIIINDYLKFAAILDAFLEYLNGENPELIDLNLTYDITSILDILNDQDTKDIFGMIGSGDKSIKNFIRDYEENFGSIDKSEVEDILTKLEQLYKDNNCAIILK